MSNIIDIHDLSFTYPNSSKETLKCCSLALKRGELLTILGANGSGKSTLLNCICGLLRPQEGIILLNGHNILNLDKKDIAKVVGYVQQNQQTVFAYTVFDYVLMGKACNLSLFQQPSNRDREDVTQVLEDFEISHLKSKYISEVSGGERQQATIARVIAQNPQVILFDEPTSHLDYGNQLKTLRLINALREKGFFIIMTTHNPDHCLMLGGKVGIIDNEGKLEIGKSEDILSVERLKQIYSIDLHLTYVNEVQRKVFIPRRL